MLSEMTAIERNEWIARAALKHEIADVRSRGDLSQAHASKLVFKKYRGNT
jgi:hypothetical protein